MSTVDIKELDHFKTFLSTWWNINGDMAALHAFNTLRIPLIEEAVAKSNKIKEDFFDITILDVGCGGGILCEPLSKLDAKVTGIDPSEELIQLAKIHSEIEKLDINYIATTIEEYSKTNSNKYDVVVASEVLEHVVNPEQFIENCVKCLKPSGTIILTTINKTVRARLVVIYFFEYFMKSPPKGTHEYSKFVKPQEVVMMLKKNNCTIETIKGCTYNPFRMSWKWCTSLSTFYAICATKNSV